MHVAQSERRSETNALEQGIVSGEVSTEAVGSTYVIKRALQALHAAPCMCSCRRLITRRKPKYAALQPRCAVLHRKSGCTLSLSLTAANRLAAQLPRQAAQYLARGSI